MSTPSDNPLAATDSHKVQHHRWICHTHVSGTILVPSHNFQPVCLCLLRTYSKQIIIREPLFYLKSLKQTFCIFSIHLHTVCLARPHTYPVMTKTWECESRLYSHSLQVATVSAVRMFWIHACSDRNPCLHSNLSVSLPSRAFFCYYQKYPRDTAVHFLQ